MTTHGKPTHGTNSCPGTYSTTFHRSKKCQTHPTRDTHSNNSGIPQTTTHSKRLPNLFHSSYPYPASSAIRSRRTCSKRSISSTLNTTQHDSTQDLRTTNAQTPDNFSPFLKTNKCLAILNSTHFSHQLSTTLIFIFHNKPQPARLLLFKHHTNIHRLTHQSPTGCEETNRRQFASERKANNSYHQNGTNGPEPAERRVRTSNDPTGRRSRTRTQQRVSPTTWQTKRHAHETRQMVSQSPTRT